MKLATLLVFTLLHACGGERQAPTKAPDMAPSMAPMDDLAAGPGLNKDAVTGVESLGLRRLLSDHWELQLKNSPVWATRLGDHRFDDQLSDNSPGAIAERREQERLLLERARQLDQSTLGPTDQLTLQVFILERSSEQRVDEACRFEQWSVNPRYNAFTEAGWLPDAHEVRTRQDADNLLARYRQLPRTFADELANFEIGAAQGRYANAESTRRTIEMVRDQLAEPLESWPLMKPTQGEYDFDSEPFRQELQRLVDGPIRRAMVEYADWLEARILPFARSDETPGLSGLPRMDACYSALVAQNTTLDLSAEDLHETGLAELRRVHAEFAELGAKALGTSDLALIFERLRSDPALFFEDEAQVEAKAQESLAGARAALGEWFGRLPEAPCVVKRVPDHEAPYTTIAYYRPPNPDGTQPGEYRINVYQPRTRPRHEAQVLAFHESIPGHHLQIATAQELPAMPAFRKHLGMTVFVEGWALYTERLADEMGLYSGDLDRLGMLSFDAWRASRLVVDTGLHTKGWSRRQAEDFMLANTPLAANNIENEVDRYITTPGQALAYKVGQLEIQSLRLQAEEQLGERFDVRQFHDVVLGAGAVPLPLLRERVEAWVAGQGA